MIRKYQNHKPHGTMRKNQLSLPHQDDGHKVTYKKHTTIKSPTTGVTINNESTTEPL